MRMQNISQMLLNNLTKSLCLSAIILTFSVSHLSLTILEFKLDWHSSIWIVDIILNVARYVFENKKFNCFTKISDSNIKHVNTFIAGSRVEFVNISDGTACLFVNSAVSVHPWQFCYHSLRPSCLCICMDMSCHLRTIVSSGEC